jgi:hypothetical protein
VSDFKKTFGHVADKYSDTVAKFLGRCHSSSFFGGPPWTVALKMRAWEPRLGWYAINILRRRLDMCSDLNMPGSAADTGYP